MTWISFLGRNKCLFSKISLMLLIKINYDFFQINWRKYIFIFVKIIQLLINNIHQLFIRLVLCFKQRQKKMLNCKHFKCIDWLFYVRQHFKCIDWQTNWFKNIRKHWIHTSHFIFLGHDYIYYPSDFVWSCQDSYAYKHIIIK